MPYLYNSVEEIPYEHLQSGGTFHVRRQNCHYDLRKRKQGAVAVLTSDEVHSQGGNLDVGSLAMEGGPTPQGPWTPLIVLALKLLLLTSCIVIVSVVVGSTVVSIISDPVDVIGYDSKGRPSLLSRRRSGDVLTIGYDQEGSAYIKEESKGKPFDFDFGMILWIIVALGILVVIVMLMRSPMGQQLMAGKEKKPPPKKKAPPKEKTKEEEAIEEG